MNKTKLSSMTYLDASAGLNDLTEDSIMSARRDVLYIIDIEKEYKLIQDKKSKLSSSMRRMIVLRYERSKK